ELLKMPTCIGEARRVVLDQLGHRYRRTFTDVWEFVHFSEEQKLGLDLTSPPQKPEPAAAVRRRPLREVDPPPWLVRHRLVPPHPGVCNVCERTCNPWSEPCPNLLMSRRLRSSASRRCWPGTSRPASAARRPTGASGSPATASSPSRCGPSSPTRTAWID